MPSPVRLTLFALALPASLAAQKQYSLSGDRVAIYNLVGQVSLTAGSGSAVVVTVNPGGAQGSQLKVEQGPIRNRETLRVIYPGETIVYPAMGRGSNSNMRVNDDGTFDHDDGHGSHRVRIVGSGSGADVHADLAISVPAGRNVVLHLGVGNVTATNVDGSLDINVSSADVKVTGGRGEISVDGGAGNIQISGTDGSLSIDTGSGNVELTNVKATDVSVDTGSGDIEASGLTASRVDIDAGSGDIRFSKSQVPNVDVESGSGDITLELATNPGSLDVETGSGDVVMRLPANAGAEVHIETSSGSIETDFALQVTRTGNDELRGTMGDGRGRISIESGSGNVRMMKQ